MRPPQLNSFAATKRGSPILENDDRFVNDAQRGLFLTARGRGPTYGGYHSPVALDLAVRAFSSAVRAGSSAPAIEQLERALAQTPPPVSQHEFDALLEAKAHPTWTMSALLIGATSAALLHLGVSRIYRLRGLELSQLTTDHSVRSDEVFATTESMVFGVPGQAPVPELLEVEIASGDQLLLCTPGVWRARTHEQIADILRSHRSSPKAQVTHLVNGSARIDATAVVVTWSTSER